MEIVFNGQPVRLEASESLTELLRRMDLAGKRLALERNRVLVPRAQWDATRVEDGDRIEAVEFVGGGC